MSSIVGNANPLFGTGVYVVLAFRLEQALFRSFGDDEDEDDNDGNKAQVELSEHAEQIDPKRKQFRKGVFSCFLL